MTVKHILIPTMGVKSSGAALGTSLLLAKLFGAHAEVLFIKEDLLTVLPLAAEGLRELLMGGVTRHVLAHAEVPVLMAH